MKIRFLRSVTAPGRFESPVRNEFTMGEIADSREVPDSHLPCWIKAKHCEQIETTPAEPTPAEPEPTPAA
jgi:hypothetical protein